MKEIKNLPTRPKSSGAQKVQHLNNKELFNSTAPIKFFNSNLDDSGMRESLVSSAMQGLHGGVPAKHNLLATSMRINQSQIKHGEDIQRKKVSGLGQSVKPLSANYRTKL